MHGRALERGLVIALSLGCLAAVARADTNPLTNGRTVQGKAVEGNGVVTIDHSCGRISLPKSMVAKIDADTAPIGTALAPSFSAPVNAPAPVTKAASHR